MHAVFNLVRGIYAHEEVLLPSKDGAEIAIGP
jgi:hypothetical protein